MNELTTVFELTGGANGIRAEGMIRLAIGVVWLIAGIVGILRRKRIAGRSPKSLLGPAFMMGGGVLWLVMTISFWMPVTTDLNNLLNVYRGGGSQVVEGVVHVSHQQPFAGHEAGDKIRVGDQPFEVNYFLVTPGYKKTIAHGGVLREGVFARLHYDHGLILKVEVGKKGTSQPDGTANGSQPIRAETNRTPSEAGSRH